MIDIHVHYELPIVKKMWLPHKQNYHVRNAEIGLGRCLRVLSFYDYFGMLPRLNYRHMLHDIRQVRKDFAGRIITSQHDLHEWLALPESKVSSTPYLILSLESARCIHKKEQLDELYELGLRLIQPFHFLDNAWGFSSKENIFKPSPKGLTALGCELLEYADKKGFILDISHTNRPSAKESLDLYKGSVLYSHTGYDIIRQSNRNINTWEAKQILKRKGLIGVTPFRAFLALYPPLLTNKPDIWLQSYAQTIAALVRDTSEDTVVIGSDRGAPIQIPKSFYNLEYMDTLGDYFREEGLSANFLKKFTQNNAIEFFKRALPA